MKKICVAPVLKDPKNKPAFDFDCLTNIRGVDPAAPRYAEFDWEVLRRNLAEAREDLSETDFALLGDVVSELLRWMVRDVAPNRGAKRNLVGVGRRAISLAWMVNPGLITGSPSMVDLARLAGVSVRSLKRDSGAIKGAFGVRSRAVRKGGK